MLELKNEDCNHSKLIRDGEVVCKNCGEVLQPEIVSSFDMININLDNNNHFSQSVGNIRKISDIRTKGSYIGSENLYLDKDNNGNYLDIHIKQLYRRLKKLQSFNTVYEAKIKRILNILQTIAKYHQLSIQIIEASAYKYLKILKKTHERKEKIINNVSCILFCLWDSIKFYKNPLNLKALINTFSSMGYKIKPKMILRDEALYRKYLEKIGFKKVKTKKPQDYIVKHINCLRENKIIIKKIKDTEKYNTTEEYFFKLEKVAKRELEAHKQRLLPKSSSPYIVAGSSIYFADILLSVISDHKKLLTQELIANATKISLVSLRATYIYCFKPFLKRNFKKDKIKNNVVVIRIKNLIKELKENEYNHEHIIKDETEELFTFEKENIEIILSRKKSLYKFFIYNYNNETAQRKLKSSDVGLNKLYAYLKSEGLLVG